MKKGVRGLVGQGLLLGGEKLAGKGILVMGRNMLLVARVTDEVKGYW